MTKFRIVRPMTNAEQITHAISVADTVEAILEEVGKVDEYHVYSLIEKHERAQILKNAAARLQLLGDDNA